MKVLAFLCAAAAAFVFSGCTTYYKDATAEHLYRPRMTYSDPYYTKYSVADKRVTGTGNAAVILWIIQVAEEKQCLSMRNPHLTFLQQIGRIFSPTYKAVENAKNVALYNACVNSDADHMMGVTFDYTVRDYIVFSTVECQAKGFPAKVKGIGVKKPVILNKWQTIEYVTADEKPVLLHDDKRAPSINMTFEKSK